MTNSLAHLPNGMNPLPSPKALQARFRGNWRKRVKNPPPAMKLSGACNLNSRNRAERESNNRLHYACRAILLEPRHVDSGSVRFHAEYGLWENLRLRDGERACHLG